MTGISPDISPIYDLEASGSDNIPPKLVKLSVNASDSNLSNQCNKINNNNNNNNNKKKTCKTRLFPTQLNLHQSDDLFTRKSVEILWKSKGQFQF